MRFTAAVRRRYFNSAGNGLLTLAAVLFFGWVCWSVLDWAVLRARLVAESDRECRDAGACWAVIASQWRLIIFGTFPASELWRPAAVLGLLIAMMAISLLRRLWRPALFGIWALAILTSIALLGGGILGLAVVETDRWSGLPLTLLLGSTALLMAFPLAVLLALGRRSALPVVSAVCTAVIELIRAMPLVSLLFIASLLLPLFLPAGLTIDKLVRAFVALTLFASAYLAEVIRGGLQSIPKGQIEAAEALGLGYVQRIRFIVLPQALMAVVPALANTLIVMMKNTSLVLVVGVLDMLAAAKSVLSNPAWSSSSSEVYAFVTAIYFALSFYISFLSRRVEGIRRSWSR